ncbi:hypothetical protein B0J13DRAFT_560670 [Dactylonectria estremocensis]|uniref:Uncharacterized protein n=1 Tax=Dactylonectria estremocensis TaxID=1079267 RepID=A0A9P9EBR6_9HYPO|nr:hypothetical protein B0J13DRAFT_560670 [Dactylonectria estremocensis]
MLPLQLLVTAVVPLIMATPSTPPSDQEASTADIAPDGTRNIRMWTDDTHQNTMIKYLHVPNTYDLIDIKHADYIGMFYTFRNGDTWLTLDNKRLFLTSDMGEPDIERGSENTEEWPVMGPEELKEVLLNHPSYEELDAVWQEVQEARRAVDPLKSRTTSCQSSYFMTSHRQSNY